MTNRTVLGLLLVGLLCLPLPSGAQAPVAQLGCTPGSIISAASVNETAIKATAGTLHSLVVMSLDATPVYIKLYNLTTANTSEADTPVQRFMVPANATAALGAGFVIPIPIGGIAFTTAITLRATTGIADSSTGALTADEVVISYCSR